jgi:SPP1 family phage portal protein
MELKELLLGKVEDIIEAFKTQRTVDESLQSEAMSQYDIEDHEILDTSKRPDKLITKDTGAKNATGDPITTTASVPVERIALPYEKLIVKRRVGFMLSDPVRIEVKLSTKDNAKEQELADMVEAILDENKMDYLNKEIAERLMSELEVCEHWYFVETGEPKPKYTLKCTIWSPKKGDTLYPFKDDTGNLIAFARGYKLKEGSKDVEHFDVDTADFEYKYINRDGWKLDDALIDVRGAKIPNPYPNKTLKIMDIYHSQEQSEYSDVRYLIKRMQTSKSNHADMNDYFGSPILAVIGEIMGFAQKGEQGKILQLMDGAKANYLALESPPESILKEQENLEKDIYTMTQTPDISFSNLLQIGNIATATLKLLFLDAHMAVKDKERTFGIGLQRRLNLIKAAIGALIDTRYAKESKTLRLKPIITPYMPSNITELIDNLSIAVTGGFMAKETAVKTLEDAGAYIQDSETEMERIQNEGISDVTEPKI